MIQMVIFLVVIIGLTTAVIVLIPVARALILSGEVRTIAERGADAVEQQRATNYARGR